MDKLLILTVEHMSKTKSIAIIGGGIFGALNAIRLNEFGHDVTILERSQDLLTGASFNNQNRLHLGFHYPRDDETARQCIRGYESFKKTFRPSILSDFENAYFISSKGSNTSPEEYIKFCERHSLPYKHIELNSFYPKVKNVDLGILCGESVYDCMILRNLIIEMIKEKSIKILCSTNVEYIERNSGKYSLIVSSKKKMSYDIIINCTYSDINRLTENLFPDVTKNQYEYTMVPIIEWDHDLLGITIMDGNFMTILPFGKTGKFLLYHVEHSVIERSVSYQIPLKWINNKTSPYKNINHSKLFNNMINDCIKFVPDLANSRLVGFLHGSRMVQDKKEKSDARPSIIKEYEKGYITVFSGKIDHSIWVADEISNLVRSY